MPSRRKIMLAAIVATLLLAVASVIWRAAGEPVWLSAINTVFLITAVVLWVVFARTRPKPPAPIAANEYRQLLGTGNVEVKGEHAYQDTIRRIGAAGGTDWGSVAVLVPEPNNAHDRNAVRIDLLENGVARPVGYLPAAIAAGYQARLLPLAFTGVYGTVPATVWGLDFADVAQVYLQLAEPEAIL